MEFSSQIYRAPSLKSQPKLSKQNISSAVIRGATTTAKLRVSTIKLPIGSLGKNAGIGPAGRVLSSPIQPKEPVSNALEEINNTLVEIQKQLSLDFSYRIAKEEENTKKIRISSDKRKREKAEEGIESTNKLGQVIGKQVDKITSPIKNIFDRLIQFFGSLVTGFVINQAVKWLSNPVNIKKIQGFFDFLEKHSNTLLMILGGVLVYRVVRKIVKLYRALKAVGKFVSGFNRGKSADGNLLSENGKKGGGLFRNNQGGRRGISVEMERVTRAKPGSGGLIHEGVDVVKRTKSPIGKTLQRVDVAGGQLGRNMLKAIGMGPGAKGIMGFLRPVFKRIPIFGALIDFAVSLALGEPIGRAAAKAVGAGLGGALGTLLGPAGTILGGILGDFVGGSLYDAIVGPGKDASEEGKQPELEFNNGGTIPGPNVNKDIVPLLGTPGEKIIPKEESKRYGPFIDDMIYSGGQLYQKMIDALKKQEQNNEIFKSANEKFETVLKDYDDFVKKIKLKETNPELYESIYGTGGGKSLPTSMPRMNINNLMKPLSKSNEPMDFVGEINVNLRQPRMVTKTLTKSPRSSSTISVLPPIQMGGSGAQQVSSTMSNESADGGSSLPIVDAEDPSNFYIGYAMMELGIYGG